MFKPIIHECAVTEGDDTFTFYVREPSGREMLHLVDKIKKNQDKSSEENARETLSRYHVTEKGEAVTAEYVDSIIDMRLSAMQKILEATQEKIGVRKPPEQEKNA